MIDLCIPKTIFFLLLKEYNDHEKKKTKIFNTENGFKVIDELVNNLLRLTSENTCFKQIIGIIANRHWPFYIILNIM